MDIGAMDISCSVAVEDDAELEAAVLPQPVSKPPAKLKMKKNNTRVGSWKAPLVINFTNAVILAD